MDGWRIRCSRPRWHTHHVHNQLTAVTTDSNLLPMIFELLLTVIMLLSVVQAVDEPLALGPFALCHHPEPVAGRYVLAGHWHPCISLHGRANERLRLPCFWLGHEVGHAVGVLPAFGAFTGMHPIERRPGDRVYVVAGEEVRSLA